MVAGRISRPATATPIRMLFLRGIDNEVSLPHTCAIVMRHFLLVLATALIQGVALAGVDDIVDDSVGAQTVALAIDSTKATAAEAAKPDLPPARREELSRTMRELERTTEDIAGRFP